jgi:hypothetical protein
MKPLPKFDPEASSESTTECLRTGQEEVADGRQCCSKCGHPWPTPGVDAALAGLRAFQLAHPPAYHWPQSSFDALRRAMTPGCVVSRVFVQSVWIRRLDGVEFEFKRDDRAPDSFLE